MKAIGWKTYRTRFLVNAKQLTSSLSFVDHLGRQHCGRKGDYLVESSDGVISIAPRQIFEDIYVPISPKSNSIVDDPLPQHCLPRLSPVRVEPLKIEHISPGRFSCSPAPRPIHSHGPSRIRGKAPQPVQSAVSRVGMM